MTLKHVAEAYPEELRTTLPSLYILLEDTWERITENAAIAIGLVTKEATEASVVATKLIRLLGDRRPEWRREAAVALGRIATIEPGIVERALPQLKKLLEDPDQMVRVSAQTTLNVLSI
jgi:HEAT repeat protein